jgi:hypothetical protein
MRANYSKPTTFRRSQVAVVAMMKLARQAQRNTALRVNLRVLLLVDHPEECPVLLQKLSAVDDRVWDHHHREAAATKHSGDGGHNSHHHPFVASELLTDKAGVGAATGSDSGSGSGSGRQPPPNPYDYPICLATTMCLHPTYEIPTMDCLFRSALAVALPDEYIMFTNSDILFSTELLNVYVQARDSAQLFPEGFSMFGRRLNVALEEPDIYFTPNRTETHQHMSDTHLKTAADRASATEKLAAEVMWLEFDRIFEHVTKRAKAKNSHSAPQGLDYFLMPQWGFPRNFPPLMIGRALWDNRMATSLVRNGYGSLSQSQSPSRPGPPAIHVTQSVTAVHMGAASDWGHYGDRLGAQWANYMGMNLSLAPPGTSASTQYYSRGYCDPANSSLTSECAATAHSLDSSGYVLDFENKVKGSPGAFATKTGFLFVKR